MTSRDVRLEELGKVFAGGQAIGPVSFDVAPGELLSLLGPSGCGKTTVLRMIAGFVAPSGGRIFLRGRDITAQPAHRRGVALVFQNFALFPHLSVAGNIAFGPRRHGVSRVETARRVARLLGMLQLDGLAERRPAALSGGQQQRVALARALAIEPAVILLDEPFSSLDTKLRETTRQELRALQRQLGFTAILVTHDQAEALSLSDRIAIMQAGRLAQLGTADEIYHRPANRFVAAFAGKVNDVPGGLVRPEALRIVGPGEGIAATVVEAAFLGASSELTLRRDDATPLTVLADSAAAVRHPAGSIVHVTWPDAAVIRCEDTP